MRLGAGWLELDFLVSSSSVQVRPLRAIPARRGFDFNGGVLTTSLYFEPHGNIPSQETANRTGEAMKELVTLSPRLFRVPQQLNRGGTVCPCAKVPS